MKTLSQHGEELLTTRTDKGEAEQLRVSLIKTLRTSSRIPDGMNVRVEIRHEIIAHGGRVYEIWAVVD